MVAKAERARLRERGSIAAAARLFFAPLEPWYDWGPYEVSRIDRHEPDFADESYGAVWHFEIQWLGIHFAFQVGRTPQKIGAEQIAANKAAAVRREAARAADDAQHEAGQ